MGARTLGLCHAKPHGSRLQRLSWVLLLRFAVAAVAAVACQTDDKPIQTELIQLASGEYHALQWGGTQVERFYAVARPGTGLEPAPEDGSPAPNPGASIVSAANALPCELGAEVASYLPLQPRSSAKLVLGSPSPTLVPVFDALDDKGFGTLTFADIDCQRIDFTVPDVSSRVWFVYSPDWSNVKLGVFTRDATLIFVDPWARTQQEVTRDVQQVQRLDSGAWLVERGQLTKRDFEGRELLRYGTHVTRFAPFGGEKDVAYIDEQGAFAVRSGERKRLEDKPCDEFQGAADFTPGALVYYAPCDKRRLRIDLPQQSYEYADNVSQVRTASGVLLYIIDDAATASSTLWMVRSAEPAKSVQMLQRASFKLDYALWMRSNQLLLLARQQDNTTSVWLLNTDDKTLTELSQGIVGYQFQTEGVAALYQSGQLLITNRDLSRVIFSVDDALQSRFSFAFYGNASGVSYLTDIDESTHLGSLELQLMNGGHYSLARDVREYTEVWWPERGFLYATGGEQAGIYFARIEIPCESTSDTAWACGF